MSHRVAIGPSSFAQEDTSPLQLLQDSDCEIVPNPFGRRLTEDEIIEHLKGVHGLIAGLEPLNARVFEASPDLKVLARVGIGMNNVDQEAAERHGIKVSNTPDGPVQAVAEMTLTAMLTLCRRVLPTNAALHNQEWTKIIGTGLSGSTVLIVGYGRIGQRVGELLQAFGAKLLVFDPYLDAGTTFSQGAERIGTLSEGLSQADIVTLHAAGAAEVLGANEFAAMRDGVILLNSARGELVNEDALVAALDSGKVASTWFDAFWEEPYTGRLTGYEQALLSPHVGTYTLQCRRDMETAAVRHLLRDLGIGS